MYVRRLKIHEFKAYADVEVELQPFTVMLGPNGSGKTSVLQAFEIMTGLVNSNIRDLLSKRDWDFGDLSHLKSKGKQFGFTLDFDGNGRSIRWDLRLGARRGPGVARETVTVGEDVILSRSWRAMTRLNRLTAEPEAITQTLTQSWLSAVTSEDQDRFPELLEVADWARHATQYAELQPNQLRGGSRQTADGVGRDGGDLAGFLGFLSRSHPDNFERVIHRVQAVYPRLHHLEVKAARAGWYRLIVHERWGSRILAFNTRQVSDGLLRLLAVAAMTEAPTPRSLVMIDEIENGLHPHLLQALIELLQSLADNGTQVLVTTHSPIALNFVRSARQVLISTRDPETGLAGLTSMDQTRGYEKLKSVMDPGELWYNLGEDRMLGRPSANS